MADFKLEHAFGYPDCLVAGTDEVGRGCIAGPVVAATVIFPAESSFAGQTWVSEINDSKALTEKARERLSVEICKQARAFCIASASLEEILKLNILHASLLAMFRSLSGAVAGQNLVLKGILVDGNRIPPQLKSLNVPARAVIAGDQKSVTIAAASIIAKVWRDQYMTDLDAQYPGYGFARHKGYGTSVHLEALNRLGITPEHRLGFAPVSKLQLPTKVTESIIPFTHITPPTPTR